MMSELTKDEDLPPEPSAIDVEISDTQRQLKIDHEELGRVVRRTLAAEGIARASISVALVNDRTIHELNRTHLGHDWPTDVISFSLSEADEPVLAGELVVSAEMADTTAREAGTDPRAELTLYVVHGLLHLCGYNDQTLEEIGVMRRREGELLTEAGLINTFPMVGLASSERGQSGRESTPWAR